MISDTRSQDYAKILDLLSSAGQITVGVHKEEGARTYPDGTTISEVAEAAEYGLDQPQRSWLRAWFDENRTQLEAVLQQEMARAYERREPIEMAAERVGAWMAASMQRRIRNGIAPPNAPETIQRKKSSTPLIDTGRFRSAIMSRVQRIN